MPSLLLAAAIAGGMAQASQASPVFRAEAYVIADFVAIFDKNGKPIPGLTAADFSILVEKKIPVALSVSESPDRPGHYVLSFNPPEHLRDGKAHRLEVRLKSRDGRWRTLPLNWKPTFEKPM